MDGVGWMELVDANVLKIPERTLLSVSTRSKGDKTKTVFFDNFARALSYYGGMAQQDIIIEAYMNAYQMKRVGEYTELQLLNRCNFAQEGGVTVLSYRESDER